MILVVEGEDFFDAARLPAKALRGLLLSLMTGFRIPVLRTADPRETATFLAHLATQESKRLSRGAAAGVDPRGAAAGQDPPPSPARAALQVLGAIPGVGDYRARRLLDHFGSAGAVFQASGEELEDAEGVGPSIARRIREAAGPAPPPAVSGNRLRVAHFVPGVDPGSASGSGPAGPADPGPC